MGITTVLLFQTLSITCDKAMKSQSILKYIVPRKPHWSELLPSLSPPTGISPKLFSSLAVLQGEGSCL